MLIMSLFGWGEGGIDYWVYGDHSTKDIKHMYFYHAFISYVEPSVYYYLPIRCIKE